MFAGKLSGKDGALTSSTSKKVLISRFDRETLTGFVNPQSYLGSLGVELLGVSGNAFVIPYSEIKMVCFVRDFDMEEASPTKRFFASRPKMAGLWARFRFRDGDTLEGLLANNLLLQEPYGYTFIPPDPTFHNQKIFSPRLALTEVQILGVIGSPLRPSRPKRHPSKQPKQENPQLEMFK
ncbi:MAG TPA: hypothetical protein VKV15_03550 [Bryobacteraceae bacterium]|nr:hypothetical protein [Bryobacteraceae bacterium]